MVLGAILQQGINTLVFLAVLAALGELHLAACRCCCWRCRCSWRSPSDWGSWWPPSTPSCATSPRCWAWCSPAGSTSPRWSTRWPRCPKVAAAARAQSGDRPGPALPLRFPGRRAAFVERPRAPAAPPRRWRCCSASRSSGPARASRRAVSRAAAAARRAGERKVSENTPDGRRRPRLAVRLILPPTSGAGACPQAIETACRTPSRPRRTPRLDPRRFPHVC